MLSEIEFVNQPACGITIVEVPDGDLRSDGLTLEKLSTSAHEVSGEI